MKRFFATLCISIAMGFIMKANAQLVNCNPDPNGDPWWGGDLPEITPEIPETGFNDSIFAAIDLNYLYLCMESSGPKGIKGKLTQFVPESVETFDTKTTEMLSHIKAQVYGNSTDVPEQYWTDLVTVRPEGYVVDANDDVHIYTAEALAWLVSVVNGLNGQEADDFNGRKVTLEANVDLSAALWIPIADGTNLGDPNPDRLKFCGSFDGNEFVINGLVLYYNPEYGNFESFFGNLCGASIENVILRHVYAEGYCDRNGTFFGNAEPLALGKETRHTSINRCYIEIDVVNKAGLGTESALFGYRNEGTITNCIVKCGKVDYPEQEQEDMGLFVCVNDGTIKNCASVAESLKWLYNFGGIANDNNGSIENCYSYIGNWFGDYQVWWPPTPRLGVCVNNYGTIRNCYYNKLNGVTFSDGPAYTNQGTIFDTESFNAGNGDWTFVNAVQIHGQNGTVYETNNLMEALNDWILGQENGEVFLSWCEDNSFLGNDLPAFCSFDVTNIKENKEASVTIKAYPNPAANIIRIEGAEASEVEVFNALGQLVKTVQNTNEVNLEGLPQGVYLLRVTTEGGKVFSDKVVKE